MSTAAIVNEDGLLDSVRGLLDRCGLLRYRGILAPIAGHRPDQVPDGLRLQWDALFVQFRNKLIEPLSRHAEMEALDRNQREAIRKRVRGRVIVAAEIANREMRRRYGGPRRLPKEPR